MIEWLAGIYGVDEMAAAVLMVCFVRFWQGSQRLRSRFDMAGASRTAHEHKAKWCAFARNIGEFRGLRR